MAQYKVSGGNVIRVTGQISRCLPAIRKTRVGDG